MSTTGNLVLPLAAAPIAVQSPLPVNHQRRLAGESTPAPICCWSFGQGGALRQVAQWRWAISLDRANDLGQKHQSPSRRRGSSEPAFRAVSSRSVPMWTAAGTGNDYVGRAWGRLSESSC